MTVVPEDADFGPFDAYLEVMFQLLEGIADVERAQITLSEFLAARRRESLPTELEELLIEIFFHKCRKQFAGPDTTGSDAGLSSH